MNIEDITIREYFTMRDTSEYDVFLDVINPKNKLCGNECNLNNITFDEYHVMRGVFNQPVIEDIQELLIHIYNIKGGFMCTDVNKFLSESIFNFFRVFNYLKEYIVKRNELEANALSSTPDYRMIAVNANERLSPYSSQLTKNRLAEQFGQDPSTIGGWKYSKVFNILAANHALSTVQAEASKIK